MTRRPKVSKLSVVRSLSPRRKSPTKPDLKAVAPEPQLVVMARGEKNHRRQQFFLSLHRALSYLTPDDMDQIEPVLRRRIGTAVVEEMQKSVVPLDQP